MSNQGLEVKPAEEVDTVVGLEDEDVMLGEVSDVPVDLAAAAVGEEEVDPVMATLDFAAAEAPEDVVVTLSDGRAVEREFGPPVEVPEEMAVDDEPDADFSANPIRPSSISNTVYTFFRKVSPNNHWSGITAWP